MNHFYQLHDLKFFIKVFLILAVNSFMAEFFDNIPSGLPKLPADYWAKEDINKQQEGLNTLDKNLLASIEDISIFNKRKG